MKGLFITLGIIILGLSSCSKEEYKLSYNENQCGNNKFTSTLDVVEQKKILSDYLKTNSVEIAPEEIAILFRSSLRNENDCSGKTGRKFLIQVEGEEDYQKALQLGFYLDKER